MNKQRIDGVDFWRGLVLIVIFINHLPGNYFENWTPRNYGFSDSAEAFVFLSGVAVALAYAGRMLKGDLVAVLTGLGRRARLLYFWHLGLTFIACVLFATADYLIEHMAFMTEHGRDLLLAAPLDALLGILGLGHQLGYFNILPLYFVLLAVAPVLLWLSARSLAAMLAASGLVYLGATATGLNLPSWPVAGVWFFNPFAWQFIFAIGIAVGFLIRTGQAIPRLGPLLLAALACNLTGALLVSDLFGQSPGLLASMTWLDAYKSKTDLGIVRLLDFLALAYVLHTLRVTAWLRGRAIFAPLARMGRHGLAIFAAGCILTVIGQIAMRSWNTNWVFDLAFIGLGVVLFDQLARLLDESRLRAVQAKATVA
ncbi:OpgC family protein [Geminicoccus harenae]|uniref:OpgC family protein n=1 Tax=Geminicoccus harenae TaxID=2498453 RepID=UPI00168BBCC3|nr:OpgC domain-containing protein [Geminicoccus harenae]